jgi:hypothetical protein
MEKIEEKNFGKKCAEEKKSSVFVDFFHFLFIFLFVFDRKEKNIFV